jgi:hypothetical protein
MATEKRPATLLNVAPNRCWEPTGNYNSYGKEMYASREWEKGEKERYLDRIAPNPYLYEA